ncbi:unnamed protein product, partial [Brachionus calyciflorus]
MLITNEQRNIANQLNKMETFSKLRPPDAVRIKAKLLEKKSESSDPSPGSQDLTSCDESPRTKSSIDTNYRVKQIKKFCVDPLITSYDILFNLISQAFGIKEEFQMSYLNRQNSQLDSTNSSILNSAKTINENNYLALFNDWDLDAAFLNSSQPYLCINIEITPRKYRGNNSESIYDEWEVIHSTESALINKNQLKHIRLNESPKKDQNQNSLALNSLNRSFISNAADKAVSVIQRVFNLTRSNSSQSNSALLSRSNSLTEPDSPVFLFDLNLIEQLVKFKQPLNENELKNFLDSDGRIVQPQELRQRIFEGGCDPSKRKELWPILLDIFPLQSMTLKERNDFIQEKSCEYENFKSTLWYNSNKFLHRNSSQIVSDSSFDSNFSDEQHLYCLAHKIYKDVWRTDRNHKFYSGDSNKNIEALFNILMTYTLANPDKPYSQGMSDLLSPLYFVLKDEALSYICFCSLMKRCAHNFEIMSHTMTLKIKLLSSLIQKFDPELWTYLTQVGAEQLLFVYRWLLLECKREFPFNDSLRMFEIMWSSTNTNQIGLKTSRSNSNASNISLKLLKNINQKKINDFLNEDFIEDESDLSQNSPISINNNNNNCSNCELCDKDDEMTEIETDTDLESINGFNYYNRFRKDRQRVRRLSLNSSFYSHKTTRVQKKLEPSSLNTNCYLSELKEQQLEEKVGKKSKNKRLLNYLKKKNFKNFSNLTGNNNLSKSNSLSCVNLAQNSTNSLKRSKSEINLKISYDCRSKKVPILFARKLKSSLMGSSRFSTSEAETLRNSVSKPRPSSTSSDLSDDLNKLKLSRKKTKKRVKIANSSPRESESEFSKNKKKILFRNIKKSLEKSHLKISKKFNMMKVCQHKNSTSSKSSTSAYVSAGSVISSASSIYSAYSTPFSEKKPKTPSIPIIRVQQETPNIND